MKKPPRISKLLDAEAKARGIDTATLIDEAERRRIETSRAYELVPPGEVRSFFASFILDDDKATPPAPATLTRVTPIRPDVKPRAIRDVDAAIADIESMAESPIEVKLGVAIVRGAASFSRIPGMGVGIVNGWLLEPQSPIGAFRADFELAPTSGAGIVIEADGHAFHERTAEQATRDRSRDRWMATRGYTVLRFTGTEITRNAERCALDVFSCMRVIMERG